MPSNVAATSNSNKELNSTADECNELANCSVFKRSNEDERSFYYFFWISPLCIAKLTHRKRKAKKRKRHNWFLV